MSITAAVLFCLAPVAIDGDTVRCGNGQDWTRVRIWAVTAPERGQPGAIEAQAALQKRVAGGIMCEPRGTSYTRIVGLCYDGTGRDIGLSLIAVDKVVKEWCSYSRNYYGTCVVSSSPPR